MTRKTKPAPTVGKAEAALDEEVEESFPASDPPAFVGGKHSIGAPKKRETPPPARKAAKKSK